MASWLMSPLDVSCRQDCGQSICFGELGILEQQLLAADIVKLDVGARAVARVLDAGYRAEAEALMPDAVAHPDPILG